ncbi:MAG TPA: hypothetical protein VLR69_20135, partial [Thermoanaerobaculia bacterium]|nr:hypothetical protein [Thermoanaerobaculia bacterium]
VSVLGVGAAYAFLVPGAEGAQPLRERLRRALAVIAAALPAIVLVLGSKLYTASLGYHALFLPHDWPGLKLRLYLLVRGCIGIFTLSGGDGRIYRFLTLGLLPAGGSPLYNALLAAWIVGLPIGGALLAWRTRSPAVRFAVVWFAAHMLIVATATDIVSRHFYLGALPASLLLSWGIWSGADRLGDWTARRPGFAALGVTREQAAGLLAGIALTLLAAHAATDIATAAALHREASAATRQVVALVRRRLAEEPGAPPPRVALVNMPAILARDGIGAFAFVNGLGAALWLATRQRIAEPDLFYTYAAFADGKFANVSRPITLAELGARVRDPKSQVLMFDARTHTVVELDRTVWRAPEGYDPASAPYLEWQTGDWPWFRAYAAQPLELPLAVSPQRSWVAVRYLRAPGVAFTVTDAAGRRLEEVRAPAGVRPAWPLAVFPLAGPSVEAADLTLRPTTEVWLAGVQSFSPPADYTPESAPFLPWALRPVLQFQVEAPLQLPLSTPGCESRPCSLRLDVFAGPGRSFALT